MEILNGKDFASEIKRNVKNAVDQMAKKPMLACIIVEGDKASEIYVASKEKACAECGMRSKVIRLPQNVSQSQLEKEIDALNRDEEVTAILLQLPLPKHLDEERAVNLISPNKDADCLTFHNFGKMFAGHSDFAPCTAFGIIKLLEKHNVQIEGKHAVVVGRSNLVGRSVAGLLEHKNATVTLCHSRTKDLQKYTKDADILVVAIGKAKFITADYVKDGAVVVDVGINRIDGKIYGDVDFENVAPKCDKITPVPGGVGPLTVACLMRNTLFLGRSPSNIKENDNNSRNF